MSELLKGLWQGEQGQDLTEYALLIALIALIAIAALRGIGSSVCTVFSNASNNMSITSS